MRVSTLGWTISAAILVVAAFAAGHVSGNMRSWRASDELGEVLARVAAMPDSDIEAAGKAARQVVETRHAPQQYLESMRELYAGFGVS